MGGQACVLYGGAEFSRDIDLVLLGNDANLERLRRCLAELQAETIAIPPFEKRYLDEGLAVHFRCHHPEAQGMWVDVMTRLRGTHPFEELWRRRVTMDLDGEPVNVLSLPALIQAKKTQRDKDWIMIRRLMEANYYTQGTSPSPQHIPFWFRELRTSSLLIELVRQYPEVCRQWVRQRPLLTAVLDQNEAALETRLREEEQLEQDADRAYWAPLRTRLEDLRRNRPRS
jgi:hypothetical protein